MVSFPEGSQTERVTNHGLLKVSSAGGPKSRKRGTETTEATGAELILMGPHGGSSISMLLVVGWSISLEVQRTIKRAEISAIYMALCRMCVPSETFSDILRVVQALHKGEVDCISAGHNDADLWVLV